MTFMTFSLFLGGLAATSVPVLLHLLMRGKPKRIEFPALMFVKKHLEIRRRSYQLKHLILLALRILIFVLFGLALARPTLKLADWLSGPSVAPARRASDNGRGFVSTLATSLGSQEAPIAAAIVVDSSLRMAYVAENRTRLDVAKEFARWILSQLPSGSSIALLSSERESAVFQVDVLAAEDKIERLQISPTGRPVAGAVLDALTLLSGSEFEQRELYVLTDLSEPGWPGELATSLRNMVDGMKTGETLFTVSGKELGLFVVDVGVEEPTNASVLRLTPSPQTATPESTVFLEAELAHLGPAAKKTVELVLDGSGRGVSETELLRDTKTIDFPSGRSRRTVEFALAGLETGLRQGKLRFSTPDALTIDDTMSFTIQVREPLKILVLAQPPVRESSKFLCEALRTFHFEVEAEALSELPGKTARELQPFKAVILLDPTPLEGAVWKKLADYASTGCGVGVFLGSRADSLASFNDPSATEVLGLKLVRQARRPDGDLWMVPENAATPILSPFRQFRAVEDFPWDAQTVFRYWECNELSSRADVALPFNDGRPAVIVQQLGRGRTLTVTTPISELAETTQPWNLLTRSEAPWMFVLLAEGFAKYLVGTAQRNFNFKAGEPIVIRPDLETIPATCLLGTPSGASIRLAPDVQRREIGVPSATELGNYRIRSGGARESLDTGFSVTLSGGETVLERIDVKRLDDCFGDKNYRLVRTPREIEHGIARRRVGQELYTGILLLLALVFAGEYLLSNRFHGTAGPSPL